MEPYGAIKAEAHRWLGIAVKLLSGRDLIGSKTFAIRAKESDHRLELADQILAVADTLIAADKRINNQPDWYAILQIIGRTHDSDLIATQYRRLSLLLNPHQNNLPFADLAFKLVCDAWVILSNPSSKSVYDSEINFLSVVDNNLAGLNREHEYHQQQYLNRHHQDQQWQQQQPIPLQEQIQHPLARPVPHQPLPARPVAKQPPPSWPVPEQSVHSRPEPQNQQQQPKQRVQELGVRQSPRKVVDNTPEEYPRVYDGFDNRHHQDQQWQQQQQQQPPPFQQQIQPPLARPVPHQPLPSRPVAKQPPPSWPVPEQSVHSRPEPQKQQQQPKQRVQEPGVRQSPIKVVDNTPEEYPRVYDGLDNNNGGNVDESDTFWTTCPYCFNMYEYPRVYMDCTLRCQNCKRAFQAISIPMRPPVIEGKEAYFSCWGFFPLAITESNLQKKKDKSSAKWTPFSPMFTLPQTVQNANAGSSDYVDDTVPAAKSPDPRVYVDIDDEDAYLDDSERDDDTDDDDWGRSTTRKRAKSARGKNSSVGRPPKRSQSDKGKNIKENTGGESLRGAVAMAETSKKTVAINTRRQSGRGAKELGKLDLNVEFSNEVEERAPASSERNRNGGAGHREEDNIEGMFFEGLDEFLNNLPILVGDDKVKAVAK